jgi:hypothetical protein
LGLAQRGDEEFLEWGAEAQAVFGLAVRRVAAEHPIGRVIGEKRIRLALTPNLCGKAM